MNVDFWGLMSERIKEMENKLMEQVYNDLPSNHFLKNMNEEDDIFSRKFTNLGEINIEIEKLENVTPDKRTKEYTEWRRKMNFLIVVYNNLASFKLFKKYE